VETRALWHRPF